jgi:outer membrane receptor protein involved in Fe transport
LADCLTLLLIPSFRKNKIRVPDEEAKNMSASRSFLCAVSLGLASSAGAQETLEEIVVTATKRGAVSVQDIPGGIKAVSGDYLERYELRTLDEIARVDPSLQMAKSAAGDLQPIIRGIQSPGAGTVGVYFDETVITGANFDDGGGRTPDVGAYDIERLEILKGPQGTLFGASSMTGTVRLISNKPDPADFDSKISVRGNSVTDGDPGFGADAMVNIPVVADSFALRGVGWYERSGGFIDHFVGLDGVTQIDDANELDKVGGRIMARWLPTQELTLDAYVMYQDIEVDGPQGYSDVPTGVLLPIGIVAGPPFVIGREVPPRAGQVGDRVLSTSSTLENSTEILLYGGTVEYDLGFGNVLATISQFENDPYYVAWDTTGNSTRFFLLDPVPDDVPGIVVPEFGGLRLGIGTPFRIQQTQTREILSSELRFSSNFDGPLNFVTGFFYQDEEQATDLIVLRADPITGESACPDHPSCIADPTSPGAQALVFGTFVHSEIESYAIFGHADYELTETLTLGAGLRYYESDQRNLNFSTQNFQGSTPPTIPPAFGGSVQTEPELGLDDERSFDEVTWDASLGYQRNESQLYYFRAATGFRQGGINDSNQAAQLGVEVPDFFDPDTVLSLELGAKTSWLDDRLTANFAVFRMYWEDIQVPGQDPTGTVPFVDNAAKAEIDGLELEFAARPGERWLLNFGLTWLNAELTEDQAVDDPLGLGFPAGRDGDDIPKVPEWAFAGSAEYQLPVRLFAEVDTALRASFSYADGSTRYLNDSFENNFEIGDYFLLDLVASFRLQNWELRIFARNVTDESAVLDYFGNGADAQQKVTIEPRAIGAQLSWRFR